MKNSKATHVVYAADADGFTLRVLNGTDTIDEYNGGNSSQDSVAWLNHSDPGALPVEKLKEMARSTALDYASEYSVPATFVSENEDLLPISGA